MAAQLPVAPPMKAAGLTALLLAVFAIAGDAITGGATSSGGDGQEVVSKQSARNREVARRDAERRLSSISLPPGAIPSRTRPAGIGRRLSEPAAIPGGTRHVSAHRFWTVPGAPRRVFSWLRHHPPPGSSAYQNYGGSIYWEHGPPGTLGATGFVAAVRRLGGGTVVRADVFDSWELPRDPTKRVPRNARYLSLEVRPGRAGAHMEGEEVPPVRQASTGRVSLVAALARLVNRQPAFQLFDQPSCGPVGLSWDFRLIVFRFKDRRHGKLLAQVSQEVPIGICAPLVLRVAGDRPYALERGWNVVRRARDLIRSARP